MGLWQADKVIEKDVTKLTKRPMASFLPGLRHWLEAADRTATSTMSFLLAPKQFDGSGGLARVRFWTAGNVAPTVAGLNALTKCPFKQKHVLRLLSFGEENKDACKKSNLQIAFAYEILKNSATQHGLVWALQCDSRCARFLVTACLRFKARDIQTFCKLH